MRLHCSVCRLAAAVLVVVLLGAGRLEAGGGAENLVLVVNANSDASKAIANYYIALRGVPARNVIYIPWRRSLRSCKASKFRSELLGPVLQEINARGLALQTDYVVYSADFPWLVDLTADHPQIKFARRTSAFASITGATYLWSRVMSKSPAVFALASNNYVPRAPANNTLQCADVRGVQTRGFRGRYDWRPGGVPQSRLRQSRLKQSRLTRQNQPQDQQQDGPPPAQPGATQPPGQRYLLSTMLGVTAGRGNTTAEVLAYLERAAGADRTQPDGTFYFGKNQDIRSTTRHACFAGAVDALNAAGARARVIAGVAPTGAGDVMGLTTGDRYCDLRQAGATVLPGAICDLLTSYGGDLRKKP
ncbi:MAG: hypothetical protein AAF790_06085, partial [Planctomycetota bacterium]